MYVKYELKMYVAFVQASLSFTQVFVFYLINNLCSVELVNKNITGITTCTEIPRTHVPEPPSASSRPRQLSVPRSSPLSVANYRV